MRNLQVLASLYLGGSERIAAELATSSTSVGRLRLSTMPDARQQRAWLKTARAGYHSRLPANPA